jgi:predicted SAM-dependent methyltransferase
MKKKLIFIKNQFNFFFKKINNFSNNYSEPLPIYIDNKKSGPKVHLGSGEINLQGWINIDARNFKHTHIIDQDFELKEFTDESISEIYLCHVLEHFSFKDSLRLLEKLNKKLSKGSIIRISVPDFSKLKMIYDQTSNLEQIKFALMGGQNYENDFHKSIYDFKILSELLNQANFKNPTTWNCTEDFGVELNDWSDGTYNVNNKKIKISLNVKAIK